MKQLVILDTHRRMGAADAFSQFSQTPRKDLKYVGSIHHVPCKSEKVCLASDSIFLSIMFPEFPQG